jgi:hypothetical protein
MSRACSSDLARRAILALHSDLVVEWQTTILENRDAPIRVKLLETARQTINCRVTVLIAFQCGRRRLLLIC